MMIKILLFMTLTLPLHAESRDDHYLELASFPEHVFTVNVEDREEGIVYLTAYKKFENKVRVVSKILLKPEEDSDLFYMGPWYANYTLDDTLYRISENEYALGVRISNHCRGSCADHAINELKLFVLRPEGFKKIFVGNLRDEDDLWYRGDETYWSRTLLSEASLTPSTEMTENYYNFIFTTKINLSEYEAYYEDGETLNSRQVIQDFSISHVKTETFTWDGEKYSKKSDTLTLQGGWFCL